MAKKSYTLVAFTSTASKEDGSRTNYMKVKKRKKVKIKNLRKYDPVVRKHVEFEEKKLK
jgi:ribosomal protein L33